MEKKKVSRRYVCPACVKLIRGGQTCFKDVEVHHRKTQYSVCLVCGCLVRGDYGGFRYKGVGEAVCELMGITKMKLEGGENVKQEATKSQKS